MILAFASLALLAGAAIPQNSLAAIPPISFDEPEDHGPYVIFFDADASAVRWAGQQRLNQLIAALRLMPYSGVVAVGYDARAGTDLNNQATACARAQAARAYLIEHGVPADRLATQAPRRASLPSDLGSATSAEAYGRRVEFVIAAPSHLSEARYGPDHC